MSLLLTLRVQVSVNIILVDTLLVSSSVQVHIIFVYLKQLLVRDGTRMSIYEVVLLVVLELVLTSPLAELLE